MGNKFTIDYDLADTELAGLSGILEDLKYYGGGIYDVTAPVLMNDDLAYKDPFFTATHSNDFFHDMQSEFTDIYSKIFNGLREELRMNVLDKIDTFYNDFTKAIQTMREAETETGNYIDAHKAFNEGD